MQTARGAGGDDGLCQKKKYIEVKNIYEIVDQPHLVQHGKLGTYHALRDSNQTCSNSSKASDITDFLTKLTLGDTRTASSKQKR